MIYTVTVTFDGTQWQASTEDGQYRVGGAWITNIEDALTKLQAILPANPDGSPAVIALG
jgi:hypothetical protein